MSNTDNPQVSADVPNDHLCPVLNGQVSTFETWPGRKIKLKKLLKIRLSPDKTPLMFGHESVHFESSQRQHLLLKMSSTGTDPTCKLVHSPVNNHVSLDTLLESLPLVYDPTTRKLIFGSSSQKRSSYRIFQNKNDHDSTLIDSISVNDHDLILESPADKSHLELTVDSAVHDNPNALKFFVSSEGNDGDDKINRDINNMDEIVHSDHNSSKDIIADTSDIENSFEAVNPYLPSPGQTIYTRLQGNNDSTSLSSHSSCDYSISQETNGCLAYDYIKEERRSKKKGISDLFSKNPFSRRSKGDQNVSLHPNSSIPQCDSSKSLSPAWNIFRGSFRSPKVSESQHPASAGTACLIMEARPCNLPAKTHDEEMKHQKLYKEIQEAAKKREIADAKERQKMQEEQLRQEEQVAAAVAVWNNEILPKWDIMRHHKRCLSLWWKGLPSCIRGRVWHLAIGNELHITQQLYSILIQRSLDKLLSLSECGSLASQDDVMIDVGDQESSLDLIRLDVSRTFPQLCIFQEGSPYHTPLHNVLGAYVCYRPDVGYVQGMSFLAATLLLHMPETEAFIAFCNLLNRRIHMTFFRVDQPVMCAYFHTFEQLLQENLPQLADHLRLLGVSPDLYLLDWLVCLFSRSLPLEVSARVWDVYLRDGEEFLFCVAIGILRLYEELLLQKECTATIAQFLNHLPEDVNCDALFSIVTSVRTCVQKNSFQHILNACLREAAR